ncbi:MAG: AbrB/MazE/SpoVT family DNA-binding domain-containing protein [Candidatus Diapherotrites archaeon]|nr:AbrB/MazE/SpoVT family DNA-binding domain-containing protein [Candidatus Diapherotrites archaeon]
MVEVELTKMSSRGQIVIPQDIRKGMNLKEGQAFAVIRSGDTVLLKQIITPSKQELLKQWDRMVTEANKQAKKLGIKESDVNKIIHRRRKMND